MKLTIVIPAYNEEQAIASIIERTLTAREHIVRESPVREVDIVVVSDGSTDHTPDIAAQYDDVTLVVFEKNRGYGAAIKKGFEVGSGDLVSFLDADGTCDPNFFADLCCMIVDEKADVAIGSRMHKQSQMPRIRRLGNRIYALLLSMLSNKIVSDCASGMRVIRRDALPLIYPLPDGLHFTPAMSARVLMDDELSIVEKPMSYKERIGESKLSVVRDGLRFLHIILSQTLYWRPTRLFTLAAGLCSIMAIAAMASPVEAWLSSGVISASTGVRMVIGATLAFLAVSSITAGMLSTRLRNLASGRPGVTTFGQYALDRIHSFSCTLPIMVVSFLAIGWLSWPMWIHSADSDIVGSRLAIALLIALAVGQLGLGTTVLHFLRYHEARKTSEPPTLEKVESAALPISAVTKTKPTPVVNSGQFSPATV